MPSSNVVRVFAVRFNDSGTSTPRPKGERRSTANLRASGKRRLRTFKKAHLEQCRLFLACMIVL